MLLKSTFTLDPCAFEDVERLRSAIGCSETLAWVLVRRGLTDPARVNALLDDAPPRPEEFHDPFLLGDMRAAVDRIHIAVEDRQPIAIHGDYDADGVCATTLLVEALEALGADVRPFLPQRFTNGYGLKIETVERLAQDGARLIVTVDCGITAIEPIAHARDHGIDVIVCDHHQPGSQLPNAILCSTRPSDYPFPELCATAAVGKLVQALGAPYGDQQHELEAIATIGDVVPLHGENRSIVRRGLRSLRRTARPGLRALLSACDLHATDVTEQDVAFKLVPRINAVGRLGESDRAYELLRAATPEIAKRCAGTLHETNAERRRVEGRILAQAIEQVEAFSPKEQAARAYVVSGRDWHEGVVGIVAARLVERYHRPVIVIAEQDPLARGSGRSIEAFDLHAALATCDDLLVNWGGHKAAAGVTVDPVLIPQLRARLAEHAQKVLTEQDMQPVEQIDAVVSGDELSMELAEELQRLSPFGMGNERPLLLAVGARISSLQRIGEDRSHLRCQLSTGGTTAQAIAFGLGDAAASLKEGDRIDACVRVGINRYRGSESLQLEVQRLIALPTEPPELWGPCSSGCADDCSEHVSAQQLLSDLEPAPAAELQNLGAILSHSGTVDRRHRGAAVSHIARLATSGCTQVIVCADVARRQSMFAGPLHPERLSVGGVAVVSGRCSTAAVEARLASVAGRDGARLVLCDYQALELCLSHQQLAVDAIVILDPPATGPQLASLQRAPDDARVHLVFGKAEEEFALQVAAAQADARAVTKTFWSKLKSNALSGRALERVLYGDSDRPNMPIAIRGALYELYRRGLVDIDAAAGSVVSTGAPSTAEAGREPSVPSAPSASNAVIPT